MPRLLVFDLINQCIEEEFSIRMTQAYFQQWNMDLNRAFLLDYYNKYLGE